MTLTQAITELAALMSAIGYEHRQDPRQVRKLCRYHRDALARAWREDRKQSRELARELAAVEDLAVLARVRVKQAIAAMDEQAVPDAVVAADGALAG
jgi:uncharacterized membrane protein